MRTAEITRTTGETDIALQLELDGRGRAEIASGCGFLDHMLTLFASHGGFDLTLRCSGDTQVDDHHSVEDIGIALGQAFTRALGDKRGIRRYGQFLLPMDEALVLCAVRPLRPGLSGLVRGAAQPEGRGPSTPSWRRNSGRASCGTVPPPSTSASSRGEHPPHSGGRVQGHGPRPGGGRGPGPETRAGRDPQHQGRAVRRPGGQIPSTPEGEAHDRNCGLRRGEPLLPGVQPAGARPGGGGDAGPRGAWSAADRIILPGVGAFADARRKAGRHRPGAGSAREAESASRCWASVWGCSCCSTAALNMASTPAWAHSRARWRTLRDDLPTPR
jgi:hypothetical protein